MPRTVTLTITIVETETDFEYEFKNTPAEVILPDHLVGDLIDFFVENVEDLRNDHLVLGEDACSGSNKATT